MMGLFGSREEIQAVATEALSARKPPGKKRKLDREAMRLLEDDLYDFPAANLSTRRNRLEHYEKVQVSEATVSRAVKHLGWSRIKDRWVPRG